MAFLLLGILLIVLKVMDVDPVAAWSWLKVLAPFALALVWWTVADMTGYTKRKAMQREAARVQARIDRQREAMGIKGVKRRREPPARR